MNCAGLMRANTWQKVTKEGEFVLSRIEEDQPIMEWKHSGRIVRMLVPLLGDQKAEQADAGTTQHYSFSSFIQFGTPT